MAVTSETLKYPVFVRPEDLWAFRDPQMRQLLALDGKQVRIRRPNWLERNAPTPRDAVVNAALYVARPFVTALKDLCTIPPQARILNAPGVKDILLPSE